MDAEIKAKLEEMVVAHGFALTSRSKFHQSKELTLAQAAWTLAVELERKRLIELLDKHGVRETWLTKAILTPEEVKSGKGFEV